MSPQDLLVATVAVVVALFLLGSALFDWDWAFQLDKAQHIEGSWGRAGARCCYVLLGIIMLVAGWAIWNSPRPQTPTASRSNNR